MYHIIQTLLLNPHKPRWKPAINQKTPSNMVHLQSLHVSLSKPKRNKFSSQNGINSVRAPLSVLSFVPLWVTTEMMRKIKKKYPNTALKKKRGDGDGGRWCKKPPPVPIVSSHTGWQNRIIICSFQMQRH